MRPISQDELVLLAAAYLHVPSRRLRALAQGADAALREWVAGESARPLAHARHQAREAVNRLAQLGAHLITITDPAYPAGLLDLPDPPAFLCVRGVLPLAGIAIVGSRKPPEPARAFAHALAEGCGEAVVSGLAIGVDEAAHDGALATKTATLAYVGTGIGATYPPEHRDLEERIVAGGGAIASERLVDEAVTKLSLVHRDRLQAAHASAVILVCSAVDGGAMQTLRVAKDLGRPRYALRPPRGAEGSAEYGGNQRVLADGAIALPHDIKKAIAILHAR
ncbi:MAG TPA: DNA-processing protein DprA [Candidatus Baltobacteraceae bacterium]|jgi:DNA processing protein